MCVLFTSLDGGKEDLRIDYLIERIQYDLPNRQMFSNISFLLTNNTEKDQSVRLIHRREVKKEDIHCLSFNRKEDTDFLNLLRKLYGKRIAFSKKNGTRFVDFYSKPKEFAGEKDFFKKIVFREDLKWDIDKLENMVLSETWRIPYTVIKIDNFPARRTTAYSLSSIIRGYSFDCLAGGDENPSIGGIASRLEKIQYYDLCYLPKDSPWHSFFQKEINQESKIIRPHSYDILIQNKSGRPIDCYALHLFSLHREFISDKRLASRVAWFNSISLEDDFRIEIFFDQKDEKIRLRQPEKKVYHEYLEPADSISQNSYV